MWCLDKSRKLESWAFKKINNLFDFFLKVLYNILNDSKIFTLYIKLVQYRCKNHHYLICTHINCREHFFQIFSLLLDFLNDFSNKYLLLFGVILTRNPDVFNNHSWLPDNYSTWTFPVILNCSGNLSFLQILNSLQQFTIVL